MDNLINKKSFINDFNKFHYIKYHEAKADKKSIETHRLSIELKKKFISKLKIDGLNKTDFYLKAVIKYLYEDKQTRTEININNKPVMMKTRENIVNNLKIALNIASIEVNTRETEIIYDIINTYQLKGGKMNIEDISLIQAGLNTRTRNNKLLPHLKENKLNVKKRITISSLIDKLTGVQLGYTRCVLKSFLPFHTYTDEISQEMYLAAKFGGIKGYNIFKDIEQSILNKI